MLSQGGGPSFENYVSSIPPITKYLVMTILGLSISANLGIINVSWLFFVPQLILFRLQVWRLVTPFVFFGALNFNTIMSCLFLLQFSRDLEKEVFRGRKGDYLWMLILGGIVMLVFGYFAEFKILSFSLQTYLTYVGCNMQPNKTMGLMFIPVAIPSLWFPFVIIGMHLLTNPKILMFDICGLIAGHFYFFFKELWPDRQNGSLLFFMKTPGFIEKLFEPERLTNFTTRFQGRGRRLDD